MASCQTSRWVSTAPYVVLTVTQSSETATTATLSYTLQYKSDTAASTNGVGRSYTIKIGSTTVKTGTYNINGKTGTNTVTSGTHTINKTTAAQTISFSVSFAFNVTWSGTYGGTKSASSSISVSAKTKYTISYNANGGSGAPSAQTKWHGTTLTLSSTKPTRAGHSFQGWATSASGSVAYAAGASYTANAAVTLYAVWKANTYKVSYNANGGSGAPSAQTKTYGKTLTLSSTKPTRTNYTFLGWATSASATSAQYAAGASYTANSAVTLYAVWKLAYTKPKISGVSVRRCDSEGIVSDGGTSAIVEFNWSTFQTVTKVEIEWVAASVEKASKTVEVSGTSGSASLVVGDGEISTDRTYTVTITVSDGDGSSANTTPVMRTLAGTKFVIDALAGGKGISFGKPAELENHADFGYFTRFRANSTYDNSVGIYGKTTDDTSLALMHLNASNHLNIGYGPYTNGSNNTYIYGTDVIVGVSNIANPGTYRPYIRRGDTINVSIKTAGYVTNGSKDVTFFVSLTRPIIGSPTVTASSVSGFTLRQGAKYTHGSSATATVIPDSYAVSYGSAYGVSITASFSNTTDVTNNDAIGIYWSGTLTFS